MDDFDADVSRQRARRREFGGERPCAYTPDDLVPGALSETAVAARVARHAEAAVIEFLAGQPSEDVVPADTRRVVDFGTGARSLTARELWWDDAPPAVREYFRPVADELRTAASRVVQLLRWRCNRLSAVEPISDETLFWSLDGNYWKAIPDFGLSTTVSAAYALDRLFVKEGSEGAISPETAGFIQDTIEDETRSEPLARQVLVEAASLADSNPRAAWVLAVAAAELGMKAFAASRTETTEAWLISEMPSPSLAKLISEYLPRFPLSEKWTNENTPVPKNLRRILHDAAKRRNQIVHQGIDPPEKEDLVETVDAVNDFLYLLDWLSGHEWAFGNIREEIRSAWM